MIGPITATVCDRSPPPSWRSTTLPVRGERARCEMICSVQAFANRRNRHATRRAKAEIAGDAHRNELVRRRRFGVTEVRRTEERRAPRERRFDEPLRRVDLESRDEARRGRFSCVNV